MTFKKQLPNLQKDNGIYFITFVTWQRLELSPEARKIVLDSCLFFHQKRYYLFAVVIMPDHVHLLIQPWLKVATSSEQDVREYSINSEQDAREHSINSEQDARTTAKPGAHYGIINSQQDTRIQQYWSIGSIMHSIKSYSAKQIPDVMKHIGKVWQDGRYDEMIRNQQDFYNKWKYIRQNPVKAGLSATAEEYPFFWEMF